MSHLVLNLEIGPDCMKLGSDDVVRPLGPGDLALLDRAATANGEECGHFLWRATLAHYPLDLDAGRKIDLRIRAASAAEERWENLPWEWMIEPQIGLPIACHPWFTVARAGDPLKDLSPPFVSQAPLPLPALILSLGPPSQTESDSSQSQKHRSTERRPPEPFLRLAQRGQLEPLSCDLADPSSRQELRRTLEHHQPNLVVCQSGDGQNLETVLLQLTDLFLFLPRMPQLFVDAATRSQQRDPARARRLYAILSRLGIPSLVVAGLAEKGKVTAGLTDFYTALCTGEPLGQAVQRIWHRAALDAEGRWRPDCTLLYSETPDNPLVDSGREAESRSSRPSHEIHRGDELPTSPFRGLEPYDETDSGAYYGRRDEIRDVLSTFLSERRLVLHGLSGCGKTSFLRAGVLPRLRKTRLRPIYLAHYPNIDTIDDREPLDHADSTTIDGLLEEVDVLASRSDNPVPVLLDQAEDLLQHPRCRVLLKELLVRSSNQVCALLLSVRTDTSSRLRDLLDELYFDSPIADIELAPLGREHGLGILESLGRAYRFRLEEGLASKLVADLTATTAANDESAGGILMLPQFSFVLRELYLRRERSIDGDTLLASEYREVAVDKLLPTELEHVLALLEPATARATPAILVRMTDVAHQRPRVVSPLQLSDLSGQPTTLVEQVLATLVRRHLVRKLAHGRFELVHEVLVRAILAQWLPDDIVSHDALRSALRSRMPDWNETATPLAPELVQKIVKVAESLDMDDDELALLIGSACLQEEECNSSELLELIGSLPPDRLQALIERFCRSVSATVNAYGLAFACRNPPHLRGLSPIAFEGGDQESASSRHLGEVLLPILARPALDRESQENSDKKARALSLALLTSSKLAGDSIAKSDLPTHAGVLDVLGNGWSSKSEQSHPMAFWPGPWISPMMIFLTALLATIGVSWAIWPESSQSFADLTWLTLTIAVLIIAGHGSLLHNSILDAIDSDLLARGPDATTTKLRLRSAAKPLMTALIWSCFVYPWYHLYSAFSDWLYHSLFTFDTAQRLGSFVARLPGSLWPAVLELYQGWSRFMAHLPFAGPLYARAFDFLEGSSLWLQLALAPIYLIFGFLFGAMNLVLGFVFNLSLQAVAIGPSCLLLVLACRNIDRALRPNSGGALRRAATVLASMACAGLALPWAIDLSRHAFEFLQRFVWQPEVFFGEGHLATLSRHLEDLAAAGATRWLGALAPIALVLMLRLLGLRSLRLTLGSLFGRFTEPGQDALRPLIAEGSYRALSLALDLIEKRPTCRGIDTFNLVYLLAIGSYGSVLARLSSEAKKTLTARAEHLLHSFESWYWQGSWHARWLRHLIHQCDDPEQARRLDRIRQLVEEQQLAASHPADETPGSTIEPTHPTSLRAPIWEKVFGVIKILLIRVPLILVFFQLTFLGISWFLDAIFPLNTRIDVSFEKSIEYTLRAVEAFFLFPLLAFLCIQLIRSPVLLYRRLKAGTNPLPDESSVAASGAV